MKPIDPTEFNAAGPSSFDQRLKALYGDRPEPSKLIDLRLLLGLIGLGAAGVWGGALWWAVSLLSRHA